MREAHILQTAKSQNLPNRLVYFDTESHVDIEITADEIKLLLDPLYKAPIEKQHDLYMICAVFKRGETRTEKTYRVDTSLRSIARSFWEDVDRFTTMREASTLYAHNARYDFRVGASVPELIRLGYEVTEFSDESPFFITFERFYTHSRTGKEYGEIVDEFEPDPEKIYRSEKLIPYQMKDGRWFIPKPQTKKIQILSSTNIYQDSLKNLGKTFGLKKLDFDHGADFNYDDAEVYCKRDVEILEKAMDAFFDFVDREQLGGFAITAASQSFKAYRARFLPCDIYIHDNLDALLIERKAYAGGRTEMFRKGKYPRVYYVDVNSMYPAVMRDNVFPVELVAFWRRAELANVIKEMDAGKLICAEVLIQTDEPVYMKRGKRLLFPTGTFWTALSTPEIRYAHEHGHVLEIKNVCIYRGENLFKEFVDYFYENRLKARAKGDDVHTYLYKLIMNCLYGKFAQRNKRNIIVDTAPPDEVGIRQYWCREKGYTYQKVFGGKVWEADESEESFEAHNSFPAVAAHVTAYARMLLWGGMKLAGLDQLYYCDTDSLMLTAIGFERLRLAGMIDDKKLGYFKLEKMGGAEFFGGKDYVFSDMEGKTVTKIKGVSKSAKLLPPDEEGNIRFAVSLWGGLSPGLKSGNVGTYQNRLIVKTLKREYTKGIIQEDGRVIPFRLELEEQHTVSTELDTYFKQDKLILPKEGDEHYDLFKKTKRRKKILCYASKNGVTFAAFIAKYGITATAIITYLTTD
jgi:hypothetical protein